MQISFKVYEVTPSKEQHSLLTDMEHDEGIDFWRFYAPEVRSTIMVSPSKQEEFELFLKDSKTPYEVIINNLESVLEEERSNMTQNRNARSPIISGVKRTPNFKVYWSSKQMEDYCKFLSETYPELAEMETLAYSPGGRKIYAMKISSGTFGEKPIIAMESGMHAREW